MQGYAFCVWCGTQSPAGVPPVPTAPTGPPPVPYTLPPAAYTAQRADFSRIFTTTFSVWSKDPLAYFGVYVVLTLVTSALSALAALLLLGAPYVPAGYGGLGSTSSMASFTLFPFLARIVVIAVIGLIVGSVVIGGVTDFAVRRHRGESLRVMESLRRGVARFPSILGANLAVTGITVGLVFAPLAIMLAAVYSLAGTPPGSIPPGSALLTICGSLLLLPILGLVALYLALSLMLNAPAIMMEGLGAVDGLRASWRLTRGHKWSLLGVLIVLGLIIGAVGLAEALILVAYPSPFVEIPVAALVSGISSSWSVVMAAVAYDLILREIGTFAIPPPYVPPAMPRR